MPTIKAICHAFRKAISYQLNSFQAARRSFVLPLLAAAVLLRVGPARAASSTWIGSTDGAWATINNWSGPPVSVPGTGDSATFGNDGSGRTNIDLGIGGVTINKILFDTAVAASYTIGSGGVDGQTLTLNNGGGITVSSTVASNQLLNAAIILGTDGTPQSFVITNDSVSAGFVLAGGITGSTGPGLKSIFVGGTGRTTINGVIADGDLGTVGLVKTDAGTLSLGGFGQRYNGSTVIAGGTLRFPTKAPNFRYYRFTPTKFKGLGSENSVQLSELQFFISDAWTPATTVSNPGGSNPVGSGPASANDNSTGSKWLDFNKGALVYDFGARKMFIEYNWATANDGPERDPLRWKVEGSDDNVSWTMIDDRTGADQLVAADRLAWVAPGASRFSGWPLADSTNNDNLLPTNTAVSIAAGASLDLNGGSQQVASLADYSGSGGSVFNSNTIHASTLILSPTNGSTTFSGVIAGGGGKGTISLVKTGNGTQTLSGTNTCTGATTVSRGTLRISESGVLSNTAVTVSGAKATLAGVGTIYGPVTVKSSGRLAPGADTNGTPGTLTLKGGLSLITAYLDLKLGDPAIPGSNDLISVTGDLTLTNTSHLTVSRIGGFGFGTNVVMRYTGNLCGSGAIVPPAVTSQYRYEILTNTPGEIQLRVFQAPPTKTWGGRSEGVDNGTWDIGSPTNWISGGSPASYDEASGGNDLVLFDDSAGGTTAISLDAMVSPLDVTFASDSKVYTISGSGCIAGETTLTVGGSGGVSLGTANSFSGDTVVSAGTLILSNALALAGSTLNYDNQGGALSFASLTSASLGGLMGAQDLPLVNGSLEAVALTVGGNSRDTQYDGALSGGGSLTKIGGGALVLTGINTYSGATTVSNGILAATTLPSTSMSISSGAEADMSGTGFSMGTVANSGILNFTGASGTITLAGLSGSGTTTFAAGANLASATGGTVNFNGAAASVMTLGDATVNLGIGTVLIVATGTQAAGTIGGPGSLIKTGSGTLTLGGTNTYSGVTTVNEGTLTVNAGTVATLNLPAGTVNLNSPAGALVANVCGGQLNLNGTVMTLTLTGGTVTTAGAIATVGTADFSASGTGAVDAGTYPLVVTNKVRIGDVAVTLTGAGFFTIGGTNIVAPSAGNHRLLTASGGLLTIATGAAYPVSGLVGRWTFDDGTANDSSGNGYNGTIVGGPTFSTDTHNGVGKSLGMGGLGYVKVDTGGNQTVFDGGSAMTLSAWVRGWPAKNCSFVSKYGDGGQGWRIGRLGTWGNMSWITRGTANENLYQNTSFHDVWELITVTYDGAIKRFYYNGLPDGEVAATGNITPTVAWLIFGGRSDASHNVGLLYSGMLDDICFYNRALSSSEVVNLVGADLEWPGTDLRVTASSTVSQVAGTTKLGYLSLSNAGTQLTLNGTTGTTFDYITTDEDSSIVSTLPMTLRTGNVTVPSQKTLAVTAAIVDGTSSTGLSKLGDGVLQLTGINTYTGDTKVNGGFLSISHACLADAADVYMAAGVNAKLNLAFTGTDTIGSLYFGDLIQGRGTWGATGSGAEYINDTFFSGTGILLVTEGPDLHGTTIILR